MKSNAPVSNSYKLKPEDVISYIQHTTDGRGLLPECLNSSEMSEVKALEAYAAQQNAGLVAENHDLKAQIKRIRESDKRWVPFNQFIEENGDIKYLGIHRGDVAILIIKELKAENERLKQQLAAGAMEVKDMLDVGTPGIAKSLLKSLIELLAPEDHQLLEAVLKE